jgi:hypothetical protein
MGGKINFQNQGPVPLPAQSDISINTQFWPQSGHLRKWVRSGVNRSVLELFTVEKEFSAQVC